MQHPNTVSARALTALLALLFFMPAGARAAPSGISLKMADYLDSLIDAGTATLARLRDNAQAGSAAATPAPQPAPAMPAGRMKLDKINARFVERDNEIFDRQTRLIWARCSAGQRWNAEQGCVGKVKVYTFDQASQLGDGTWRVPTTKELSTLIDRSRQSSPDQLSIDTVAFPDMARERLFYWSSDEEDNSFAWAVLFIDTGIPGILYRSHRYAVRLVKSGA